MRLLHGLAKTCATFDDQDLVSRAGLVPVMALAKRSYGVNAHLKAASLAAGMIAGADSVDDMDLLRDGAMPVLFGGIRARELAARCQVAASASAIGRWLAAGVLKPWQHRCWISVRDPGFVV